jgi:hypothetical protein
MVWVSEAYGIDAVSRLAYLAALTDGLRIGAYREAGVTILNLTPVGPENPVRTIERMKALAS